MDYRDPSEVYAIIYGVLIKEFRKVQTSKFNKVADKLGYDKINQTQLKDIAEDIEEDEALYELLEKARKGEILLEDLNKYNTDVKPFRNDTLHNVITPYVVAHQKVLRDNREFNKIQREGAYTQLLFDDLKVHLVDELNKEKLFSSYKKPVKYDSKTKTLVVMISDWHIGASIKDHYSHGGYNFNILTSRLNYLLEEVTKMVVDNAVEEIVIIFSGDLTEGADMRGGQKWGLEFNMAEQIAKGTHTLLSFIQSLEALVPVRFLMIRGNHDRLTGQANKKDTIYNDSTAYVVLDTLILLKESGALKNTNIIDNRFDMYNGTVDVYGDVTHVNHGDTLKGNVNHFAKFIQDYPIKYLVTGHVHTFSVSQKHKDNTHIVVGSPMGNNDYSSENNFDRTDPSQALMLLSPENSPIIQPVFMGGII